MLSDRGVTINTMSSTPVTAATGAAGHLSCLGRSELASHYVDVLKKAAIEERALGRRNVWTRVGQREDVRLVLREFTRRARQLELERDEYLAQIDRLHYVGATLDRVFADAL